MEVQTCTEEDRDSHCKTWLWVETKVCLLEEAKVCLLEEVIQDRWDR